MTLRQTAIGLRNAREVSRFPARAPPHSVLDRRDVLVAAGQTIRVKVNDVHPLPCAESLLWVTASFLLPMKLTMEYLLRMMRDDCCVARELEERVGKIGMAYDLQHPSSHRDQHFSAVIDGERSDGGRR